MTEVLVATITSSLSAVALVLVALISNRTRQHAKAAREQVANSHSTNLREEMDERHEETNAKLDRLVQWQQDHQARSLHGSARTTRLELTTGGLVAATVIMTAVRIINRRKV